MKQRVNISLSEDTIERLKQYAWEHHTNVSQAITDWIWSAKVKNEQIRGQCSISDRKNGRCEWHFPDDKKMGKAVTGLESESVTAHEVSNKNR